jgi:hypothetical protein
VQLPDPAKVQHGRGMEPTEIQIDHDIGAPGDRDAIGT